MFRAEYQILTRAITVTITGRGGALVETMTFNRRVVATLMGLY